MARLVRFFIGVMAAFGVLFGILSGDILDKTESATGSPFHWVCIVLGILLLLTATVLSATLYKNKGFAKKPENTGVAPILFAFMATVLCAVMTAVGHPGHLGLSDKGIIQFVWLGMPAIFILLPLGFLFLCRELDDTPDKPSSGKSAGQVSIS